MTKDRLDLYRKEYIEKDFERLALLRLLADRFGLQSALYPGSYTHVTPAFVFRTTCFVDTDRRARPFFADPSVFAYVKRRKIYAEDPVIRYHHVDYTQPIPESDGSFDLLISQYAGFVSQACKRYLRIDGLLLANNSHGDAAIAALDPDYLLIAVVNRRGERYSLSDKHLDCYFVPKRDIDITREYLEQTKRGVGYTKSASSYLFRRVA